MYKQVCLFNDYYCAKNQFTAILNSVVYNNLARVLLERIGNVDFFNGSVSVEYRGIECLLTVTLIVYRKKTLSTESPALRDTEITDIVPVWWEFRTVPEKSAYAIDFSWNEFRDHLLQS